MYEVAKKYYQVLERSDSATPEEKELLKAELDELSAPFSESGDIAYYAFLEMERLAKGLGKSNKNK